jgi:PEP-CTERM motif
MIRSFTLVICLLVSVCLAATAQASVMLDVALANPLQTDNEVSFDIFATFSSPNSNDFLNALTLSLENSSADLISAISVITSDTNHWDGGSANGIIDLTAPSSGGPGPYDDYLRPGVPRVLARLLIDTTGLANGSYLVSLAFPSVNEGQGTLNGFVNEILLGSDISTTDVNFKVSRTAVIPEPGSMAILGLGAVSILFGYRWRGQR